MWIVEWQGASGKWWPLSHNIYMHAEDAHARMVVDVFNGWKESIRVTEKTESINKEK